MYSTIVWIALAGFSVPESSPEKEAPRWLNDYTQGRAIGAKEEKPVLVVVGEGGEGWAKLSRAGKLNDKANDILADRFVCVYADIKTAEGWLLARSLGLTKGLGIVISDRSGKYMAFHHEGNLADDTLARYLTRYGDPNRVFVTTETNPGDTLHTQPAPAPTSPRPTTIYRNC